MTHAEIRDTLPFHAQTHLQLFAQLRSEGYGDEDLITMSRAFAYASELFAGVNRGSGKPFSCHLVGTASVLVSLRAPIHVVAASLLHAAYQLGDFGAGWLGRSEIKRAQVRRRMGDAIEALIDRYTLQAWDDDTPAELVRRLERGEPIDRDVVMMRLANELDDHLDLGILYCHNATERLARAQRMRPAVVELAQGLNQEPLRRALTMAFDQCLSAHVPESLRTAHDLSFAVPAVSRARWRWWRLLELAKSSRT